MAEKITSIKQLPLCDKIESGEYAAEWIEVGLTEGPRVSREDVVTFFTSIDVGCKHVVWASNSIYAGRAARLLMAGVSLGEWDERGEDIPNEWIDAKIEEVNAPPIDMSHSRGGQHDVHWVAHLLAYDGVVDVTPAKLYEPIVRGSCWFFAHSDTIVLSPRVTPKLNQEGQLHCTDGHAIWPNIYALGGVVLPREYNWVVEERESLTQEKILNIDNQEVKRVTIAAYPEKFITGDPLQEDDFGKLYDVEGEDYRYVHVTDSSTDREYWIRVEPTIETAHAGIASTFGMTPEEYNPEVQT